MQDIKYSLNIFVCENSVIKTCELQSVCEDKNVMKIKHLWFVGKP